LIRRTVTLATAVCLALSSTTAGAAPKVKPPTEEQIQAYLADKPEVARPLFRQALTGGDRNQVLYLMRAGLASMDAGDFRSAAEAFDQALAKIELVYSNNPSADKARSKFVKESAKDFKGEGYERSMAYYYRGVLYLHEGDYDNARASFMSAQLQDQWAEDTQYASDFALMDVLSGWASQCAGDPGLASEFYSKAREKSAEIAIPDAGDRVLMLAEMGRSPEKWADGKYQENLRYKSSDGTGPSGVTFRLGDSDIFGRPGESLYRQASTRGGREVDTILAGKASFKNTTAGMAQGAGQAAMMAVQQANTMQSYGNYSGANTMAYAGLAIGAFGLLSAAASSAAKPQADTRYWDNLPESLVFATSPPLGAFGQIEYRSGDGVVATALLEPRPDPRGSCSISWSRDPAGYAIPEIAPNSELKKKS
jgi:tetratricopeptide (TPR) repeat protein